MNVNFASSFGVHQSATNQHLSNSVGVQDMNIKNQQQPYDINASFSNNPLGQNIESESKQGTAYNIDLFSTSNT